MAAVADVATTAVSSTKAITASIKGGSALARHLKSIEDNLGKGSHVRVGFLAGATYPFDNEGVDKKVIRANVRKASQTSLQNQYGSSRAGLHVAQVAFWQEYGTDAGVPERPFIRDMVNKRSPRWGVKLGNILRKNDYDAQLALTLMGELIKGQMQQSINSWATPPNSPQTAKEKGFSKPLIDTAVMLRSVDYQVMTGDGAEDD